MNYKILDCTLRDGGYYTDWKFDKHLVRKLVSAPTKLIFQYVKIIYYI